MNESAIKEIGATSSNIIYFLQVLEPDSNISVNPDELSLIPGEEQEMTVTFSPKDCRNTER